MTPPDIRAASFFHAAIRPVLSTLGERLIDRDSRVRQEAARTFKALGKESEAARPAPAV